MEMPAVKTKAVGGPYYEAKRMASGEVVSRGHVNQLAEGTSRDKRHELNFANRNEAGNGVPDSRANYRAFGDWRVKNTVNAGESGEIAIVELFGKTLSNPANVLAKNPDFRIVLQSHMQGVLNRVRQGNSPLAIFFSEFAVNNRKRGRWFLVKMVGIVIGNVLLGIYAKRNVLDSRL